MKRMHIHVAVNNLAQSIAFYSQLFGVKPTVEKTDYAKWMLEDPLVNFAISQRSAQVGIDHIGIQVDNEAELTELKTRMDKAEIQVLSQEATTCCYAKSNKHWVQDPSGIAWETYHTLSSAPTFGGNAPLESASACCAPMPQPVQFGKRQETGQEKSCG